jgi:hypothetical protein
VEKPGKSRNKSERANSMQKKAFGCYSLSLLDLSEGAAGSPCLPANSLTSIGHPRYASINPWVWGKAPTAASLQASNISCHVLSLGKTPKILSQIQLYNYFAQYLPARFGERLYICHSVCCHFTNAIIAIIGNKKIAC